MQSVASTPTIFRPRSWLPISLATFAGVGSALFAVVTDDWRVRLAGPVMTTMCAGAITAVLTTVITVEDSEVQVQRFWRRRTYRDGSSAVRLDETPEPSGKLGFQVLTLVDEGQPDFGLTDFGWTARQWEELAGALVEVLGRQK